MQDEQTGNNQETPDTAQQTPTPDQPAKKKKVTLDIDQVDISEKLERKISA